MTTETLSIETLTADPANARRHSPRNLEAIKASLKRFGQQKPIVVDPRGIVRAGNGTLAAARALGWKTIQIVRTHLAGAEAAAYAIADNRTSDLSDWDDDALAAQLESLQAEGIDLTSMGFDDKEFEKLTAESEPQAESMGEEKWLVVVTCKDELDQVQFLQDMETRGRPCRALLS